MSSVSIRGLSVRYTDEKGNSEAVRDITFDVPEGMICTIIGPSGAGKSTLLSILAGINRNYQGTVLIDGTPPDPRRLTIGYIPQNYGLLPWKRVWENIILPAKIKGIDIGDEFVADAEDVVSRLNLNDKLRRYPSELSGGERQRVALARAFVSRPDLLLMDEPFSALDTMISMRSKRLFRNLWERRKVTSLIVTHDISDALSLSDRIVMLGKSPGTVLEVIDMAAKDPKAVRAHIDSRIEEEWV